MGVGLRDQPDAGPASVAEHHGGRPALGGATTKQPVLADLATQHPAVVAEFADLRRRLVDQPHPLLETANGSRQEQGILLALLLSRRQSDLVNALEQDVDAG